jgi:peptidoglycan hydrolase CwlO-like protein
MTKKLFLAVVFIFSLQPFFAQAANLETASEEIAPAKFCEQQQHQIKILENDREKMTQEIHYLQDEVRRLNQTLDEIRSQAGNSEPRPLSY